MGVGITLLAPLWFSFTLADVSSISRSRPKSNDATDNLPHFCGRRFWGVWRLVFPKGTLVTDTKTSKITKVDCQIISEWWLKVKKAKRPSRANAATWMGQNGRLGTSRLLLGKPLVRVCHHSVIFTDTRETWVSSRTGYYLNEAGNQSLVICKLEYCTWKSSKL